MKFRGVVAALAAGCSLTACSAAQPGPASGGTAGTPSGIASPAATGEPSTAGQAPTASVVVGLSESGPRTYRLVPALTAAPTQRWTKPFSQIYANGEGYRRLAPAQGEFLPGNWSPANGGRWITLVIDPSGRTLIRSFDVAQGAVAWEHTLGTRASCTVGVGPEFVCATGKQLVFLDLKTGGETRTVPVADVKDVAVGSNGEIVTLSWTAAPQPSAGPGGPTPAPLTATLRHLDAAGAEVWAAPFTLTSFPSLDVTIAGGMVLVQGQVVRDNMGQTTAVARRLADGAQVPGVADGEAWSTWGRWLVHSNADHTAMTVADVNGVWPQPVAGGGLATLDSILIRDASASALPLLTAGGDGTVRAFDGQGRQLWQAERSSVEAYCGGLLFTADRTGVESPAQARDPQTGVVRWSQPGGPLACDGPRVILGAAGTWSAVELATGKVAWQGPGPDYVSVVGDFGFLVEVGKSDTPDYAYYR
jgi:hypothetical protein